MSLAGRRVLVVGASRGIGAAIARGAAADGAQVVATARTAPDLPGVTGVVGDVGDPASCTAVVDQAGQRLGGIDALVYCAALLPLAALAETSPQTWSAVFDTNARGAALVTAAALPALMASGGRAAYLSSDIVAVPRAGLGAYAVSKAALDMLVECWRLEAPGVGFTRVTVGPTLTTIASGWDLTLAAAFYEQWKAAGTDPRTLLMPDEAAAAVLQALSAPHPPPTLTIS